MTKFLAGAIFSFSGFIFLTIIGALLKLQPMFVHNAKKPKKTAIACFEAAGLYALFTVGCVIMYKRERGQVIDNLVEGEGMPRDRSYYEIEDSEEELPLFVHVSPAARTSYSQSSTSTKTL